PPRSTLSPTRRSSDLVEHAHTLAHKLPLDAEVCVGLGHHADRPAGTIGERAVLAIGGDLGARQLLGAGAVAAWRVGCPRAFRAEDRKSTRLNSSHDQI